MKTALFIVVFCSAVLLAAVAGEPPAGTEIVYPDDGSIMVWVPGGTFTMGMDQDEADKAVKALGYKDWLEVWAWEWLPAHRVYVQGYFIDPAAVSGGGAVYVPVSPTTWAPTSSGSAWVRWYQCSFPFP